MPHPDRARLSLEGLSLGDAFGERFFLPKEKLEPRLRDRVLPSPPIWRWTDDTAMALSIVEELEANGAIDPGSLARRFARRYREEPYRGYGGGAHHILSAIGAGAPWQDAARSAFGGEGSMGNGGAMRAAPIGAFFADELERVVDEAARSAEPTHAHPDGRAGAIAIAVAAALASTTDLAGRPLIEAVVALTPEGPTREGLVRAAALEHDDARRAAQTLGSGALVLASDTVPFAVFCVSRFAGSFEEAMWQTVSGEGDRDTTCAIVGGVVALRAGASGLPAAWLARREPLPAAPAP